MNWLAEILRRPDIGWADALDIAIVSFLLYELLLLIRGTRAAQMALSAGFILLLYFLSQWLQLETVNWVIRNLAAYVVFAIIVLFQADIRRALAHFGRAPFFRYFDRAEHADETIEELVTAATNLAARRTGAIIVLERQIGLRNYIEGGIPLDAMITYDLLSSIFQQASPLHDGAVIIQGDRIAAAACFLPLSVNPRVSRDLGTRHRAALGLTEENDAIAMVVSIALAALLWVAVAGEQTVERSLRIPLEFTNLPAQLEVVGDAPTVIDARVRGSSGALNRIAAGELVAVLDLRSARAGQRLFHLGGDDVRRPFGVDVVQVNPSTVSMAFEPSGSKIVPVVPTVEGEPADGFVVGTVTAEPSTVEVQGPVSILSKLTQAITEPIAVFGASAPLTETVNIGVADASLRLRTPQTARVAVVVAPAPVEWSVGNIAVKPRHAAGRVQVVPARVTAWVRGPREVMTSDGGMFDATVDVEGLKAGDFQLPVSVVAPARVGVVRLEPAEVKVRIK